MSETEDQELRDLRALVGPERVDTKELEIKAHNPMVLQKLLERRKKKPVLFGSFAQSRVAIHGSKENCPRCTEASEQVDPYTG